MSAALNVFMSNRFSDSLPDSTLLGISGAELRELLGGATRRLRPPDSDCFASRPSWASSTLDAVSWRRSA